MSCRPNHIKLQTPGFAKRTEIHLTLYRVVIRRVILFNLRRGFRVRQQFRSERGFYLRGHFRMILQVLDRVVAALSYALFLVRVPCTRFLHELMCDAHVHEPAEAVDALPEVDIELHDFEGRGALVLHDLDFRLVRIRFVAVFERLNAANIEPDRGVKLESISSSCSLWL